jgi:phosphate transport system protein
MRDTYHEELDALTDRLVEMTRLVRSAISRATTALLDSDLGLAEGVISGDKAVDLAHDEVEASVLDLMARQQPVATDLRKIISALRMAGVLERMGDLAVHVARTARRRHPDSAIPPELRDMFLEMGQISERLVTKAGSVIASHDVPTALELESDDDALDKLQRQLFTKILSPNWPHGIEAAVDITLAQRYYERYGDHAVHLARNVVYLATGERP